MAKMMFIRNDIYLPYVLVSVLDYSREIMRICIVCSRLGYGGAERVAVLWANGFNRSGHDVMVVSNLFDPITYKLDDGILVRNLVSDNRNRIKKAISSFYKARKHFKEFSPDVIIGVMEMCSIVSRFASLRLSIPVIMTEHYAFERTPYGELTTIERICKFYVNRLYSFVTVLTEADKEVIGDRLRRIKVMSNPLALLPIEKVPQKDNTILAVGRLDGWKVKGFDVLIRAWGLINRQLAINNGQLTIDNGQNDLQSSKLTGWRLQIAGTGSEESLEYLKQLCKENGVTDSVDFLGFVSDVQSLYQKASVFVLSSRYEGFGLALIEAMSQGCACVACDYKGRQREIIQDDSQGICCEPDNVEALSSAIIKMVSDEDYRESVRPKAIDRSRYYSIENTIDRWEEFLNQIMNK